jgi:hypothetical protein
MAGLFDDDDADEWARGGMHLTRSTHNQAMPTSRRSAPALSVGCCIFSNPTSLISKPRHKDTHTPSLRYLGRTPQDLVSNPRARVLP